jgi:hypothetical protein
MNEISLCSIHDPGVDIIGMITPHLAVVRVQDTYALVELAPGCDHVLVTFSSTPQPDPVTPEIEARFDESARRGVEDTPEDSAAARASIQWISTAREAMRPLRTMGQDMRSAWCFVNDLMTHTGYSIDLSPSVEVALYTLVADTIAAGHSVTGVSTPAPVE